MSYFSTILTATKSRYQTLRGIDEQDGDTEDDSHIARVLRNYYTEQQRPIPDWLGGGPPPPQNLRNNYGQGRPGQMGRGNNSNATLSDIWDSPPPGHHQQHLQHLQQHQQHHQQPQRPGLPMRGQTQPQPQRPNLFPEAKDEARHSTSNASGVAMTAQQRIKERLWGGKTNSPPPSQAQQHPPPAPTTQLQMPMRNNGAYRPQQQAPPQQFGGGRPYVAPGMPWDDGNAGGGGGYSDGYDGSVGYSPGFTPAGSGVGSQGSSGNLRRGRMGHR